MTTTVPPAPAPVAAIRIAAFHPVTITAAFPPVTITAALRPVTIIAALRPVAIIPLSGSAAQGQTPDAENQQQTKNYDSLQFHVSPFGTFNVV